MYLDKIEKGETTIMNTVNNRLEEHIVCFASLLRQQGLQVGTAEIHTALLALSLTGLADRSTCKVALQVAMVKKADEQGIFDKTFAYYFQPPADKERALQQGGELEKEFRQGLNRAEAELVFKGEPLSLNEEERTVYASLSAEERERIKNFVDETERGKKVEKSFRPVLETIVKSSLRYREKQSDYVPRRGPETNTGDPRRDWVLGREGVPGAGSGNGSSRNGETALKDLDMSSIPEKEIPLAAELVRKMSRRLAVNLSRRYRRTKKRKTIDIRKTIRDNISYGGYLYRLRYRSRRRHKPRLLLLCDVSGSMLRYAGFILPFIYGLSSAVGQIECFVFSESLQRITPYLRRGHSFEETVKILKKEDREWGKGTKIYAAFKGLCHEFGEDLTPGTVVLVVSDTRTLALEHSVEMLKKLKAGVREVIWLNTLPRDSWNRYPSVAAFAGVVPMVPGNRIRDLEQVFNKLL